MMTWFQDNVFYIKCFHLDFVYFLIAAIFLNFFGGVRPNFNNASHISNFQHNIKVEFFRVSLTVVVKTSLPPTIVGGPPNLLQYFTTLFVQKFANF